MPPSPVAFMSYVTREDRGGKLTQLRQALSEEVFSQTGKEFPIFQDCEDIKLGEDWRKRLDDSLDAVTFLIPIITPSFFNSQFCRYELQRFLDRERQLGRSDLILPIYYVKCPIIQNPAKLAQDELAQVIAARQWADWTALRWESFDSKAVGLQLEKIAIQIRDALERVQAGTEVVAVPVPEPPIAPEELKTEQQPERRSFRFEVITVNAKGVVIKREPGKAESFKQTLGEGVDLEMVTIPGGTFLMGSPEGEEGRDVYKEAPNPWNQVEEGPLHEVKIAPLGLGRYTVTQAQYESVMGKNPAQFVGPNRPVEQVSWQDAVAFCTRLTHLTGQTYRLPSEAEWEYACRAGTRTPFHFGLTLTPEIASYRATYTYAGGPEGQYREQTSDVGQFPPNAFGLYDMHGNVWEWCADHFHMTYRDAPQDGRPWLDENDNDSHFVVRGGSWSNLPQNCRSACRNRLNPVDASGLLGFRVACSAPRS